MNPIALKGAAAVLVLVLAAVVWVPLLRPSAPAPEVATMFEQPRRLPDVALVDHLGRPFSLHDLEDRFSLMFFGFTHCPDICPITLHVLAEARAQLEARRTGSAPDVVLVSVDPARDTPDRLREYLANFQGELKGVTADDEALAPLLSSLGIFVQRHEHHGEHYNVVHNGTVFVIGPRADLVGAFGAAEDAAIVAQDFERIRTRYLRNPPAALARL